MSELRIVRVGTFSRRVVWQPWRRTAVMLALMSLCLWLCLSLGKVPLAPLDVGRGMMNPDSDVGLIVLQLRMPRVLLAALVGGALALSGWLLQQVMRNPLASPDTLGVTSGASAAAVSYFAFLGGDWGMGGLPLAAIAGALIIVTIVYLLAWHRGVTPLRLVLMGIGMAGLMAAVTTFVLVFSPLTTTLSAYVWLTGSVYGANWGEVQHLAGWCGGLMLLMVPALRFALLAPLDDAMAAGLGVRVQYMRAGLTLLAAALAGVAIAWGGAMAFVGLVSPHLAHRLTRSPGAAQMVMAVAIGASMVMLADLLGRTLFLPLDLPAGIFVAAIGAPFFLALLVRQVR